MNEAYARDLAEVIRRIAERGVQYAVRDDFGVSCQSSVVDLFQHILDESQRLMNALDESK